MNPEIDLDMLNAPGTDRTAYRVAGHRAVIERKAKEAMANAHFHGRHHPKWKRIPDRCVDCATANRIDDASDGYVATEWLARAFSPTPVPKGFR
jgi:hypothetical protein